MKEIIELVCEVREFQKQYFKTRSKDVLVDSKMAESKLDKALAKRKELEATPITEEWLKEHGFTDEPQERILIYRKWDFGIECDLTTWEWYWANGDVVLCSLADLYDACELCGIKID